MGERCAIAVMAKAPRPGFAKTRLVPPLTADGAAALSAAFLRDITDNIALAGRTMPIDPWIAYAPEGAEGLFAEVVAPGTKLVLADGDTNEAEAAQGLGKCLLHAACRLLGLGYSACCLVNADGPTLPTRLLLEAAELLASGDAGRVVLGPAEDGGYYLIGMRVAHPRLFEKIAWSTPLVAAQTRERAQALGLELIELAPWYDVDDPESLSRLAAELDRPKARTGLSPFPAPATAACLARLGVRS